MYHTKWVYLSIKVQVYEIVDGQNLNFGYGL